MVPSVGRDADADAADAAEVDAAEAASHPIPALDLTPGASGLQAGKGISPLKLCLIEAV